MKISPPKAWLSWASVTVLALLCGVLAVLQYRSLGEIATAERTRLYEALQTRLISMSRAFNEEIAAACSSLLPPSTQIEAEGRENAYASQYAQWQRSHGHLFRRIALAVPQGEQLSLLLLNESTGRFNTGEWPSGWERMRDSLSERVRGGGRGPGPLPIGPVLEIPRFAKSADGTLEREWVLFELDPEYLRTAVFPELVDKYLSEQGKVSYDAVVVNSRNPSEVIFKTDGAREDLSPQTADASVPLLTDTRFGYAGGWRPNGPGGPDPMRPPRAGGERMRPEWMRLDRAPRGPGGRFGGPPPNGPGFNAPGRWRLLVQSRAGSLEALVQQSQRRSLATSASILLLILATVAMLVRFSRQAQRLAELQINFVAGVSHELRTPLTVMRTAAYNLRTARIRSQPEQVERYGRLIETESEKLERLVEDVLRFASGKAGHVIRSREPVAVSDVIEKALASSRIAVEGKSVVLEERISPALPMVMADGLALRHALQNLVDNAIKYGTEGGNWVGVYAEAVIDEAGSAVRIRVADRGPGIPPDELSRLFDPFFRGRRAVQDQVHGTGLGLNLAKTIIEAHGGVLSVKSVLSQGCEFTVRIPAAPPEVQHECAYSAG